MPLAINCFWVDTQTRIHTFWKKTICAYAGLMPGLKITYVHTQKNCITKLDFTGLRTLHQEIPIVSLFSHGGTTFVHRKSHSTTGKQTKVWEFSKFSCIRRPLYIRMLLSCITLHSSCIVRYIRMYSFIICNGLLLVYCTDICTYVLG